MQMQSQRHAFWAALKHFAEAAELEANLSKTQMVADQVLQMKSNKNSSKRLVSRRIFPYDIELPMKQTQAWVNVKS